MKKYISIDIGGTAIKYGIVSEDAEVLLKKEMKTEAQKGGPAILDKVIGIVEALKEEADAGVCISTAGMVDIEKGEIFYSAPLIPNYIGTAFKKTVEERFGIPCEVENDVNCAGLAEYKAGAAAGSKAAVMLTIGTGIGGCILLNGEVFHGFSSDFQTLGAASILTKKVAAWKGEPAENWSGYRIFEEAKKGDKICNRAIDEMTDVLGKGIANICYVVNPEVVVLGGGIMAQEAFLKDKIEKAVEKYLVSSMWEHTSIAFAKNQNNAGMLGAFYHFQGRHA